MKIWIARDKYNHVTLFYSKPHLNLDSEVWISSDLECCFLPEHMHPNIAQGECKEYELFELEMVEPTEEFDEELDIDEEPEIAVYCVNIWKTKKDYDDGNAEYGTPLKMYGEWREVEIALAEMIVDYKTKVTKGQIYAFEIYEPEDGETYFHSEQE